MMGIPRSDEKILCFDRDKGTWIYSSVKIHQTVYLALVYFTIFKLCLNLQEI